MVQRRYARYTCNDFGRTSSVTAMLQQIGWETLQERRAKSRLAMQYRIAHNLVDVPAADHLQTYNSRKGNATKFRVPYARTVAYRHTFCPHHHHIVSATALIHRTARPSISAMSYLLGISPKCIQLVMIWFRSHVAAPHIQCLFSR